MTADTELAPKILLLLLIVFCFCTNPALSVDRIFQSGTSLASSNTLLSNNANFTLGFQRIGTEQYNASYLGIWYNGPDLTRPPNSQARPFWLANPNNPILDDSGALAIDASGNFKLSNSTGHVLTLYPSQSSSATNFTAILLDSGNLILKEADSPDDKFLWQSFDFPTDTLLPGMKLGINRRTNHTWSLNSRLTEPVPSSGAFNLDWDPTEHQLVIKRRGVIFWTSGPLTSNDSFETFSMRTIPPLFSLINVSNVDEDSFMFTTPFRDGNNFSSWTLRDDGSIIGTRFTASGTTFNVVASNCDGNGTEFGCRKWEGPKCRNDGDKFVQRSGYFFNPVGTPSDDNSSLSISDCKDMCWKDCQCVGIPLEYNANNTGCMFYYGNFTQDPTEQDVAYYVIVQGSPPSPPGRNWIWILIAVTLVVTIALGSILFYLRRKRIRAKLLNDLLATDDTTNELQEFENDGNNGHNLKMYRVAAIMAATNSFSLENKLGQGGFGPVYKGKLPEGREIAVKRLSRSSGQGLVEFKNELILIAKLQHRNLVRLLGFCIHGEEKMLVYEYMPNKSLDSFIFDSSKSGLIDWKRRFAIIEGIAQGMLYLHKYSRLRIIHRDLKASNILLDQDMNPKISDFGMARIFKINQLESNTNRIVGTYGYMSPEYAMEGIFSVKSDVFSFGVLLLEIVSGRKNHGFLQMDRPLNLIGYAWELWQEGNPLELMDPTLRESFYSKEEVLRCIKLGLLCVEDNPTDRPTMSDVVTMLASDAAQLPAPKQPAFSNARSILDVNSSFEKRETNSVNTCPISTLEAR